MSRTGRRTTQPAAQQPTALGPAIPEQTEQLPDVLNLGQEVIGRRNLAKQHMEQARELIQKAQAHEAEANGLLREASMLEGMANNGYRVAKDAPPQAPPAPPQAPQA
jgi:hypothetical protein